MTARNHVNRYKMNYIIALLLLSACGKSETPEPQDSQDPAVGEEMGACYGNQTCNDGLSCVNDMCVLDDSTDSMDMGSQDSTQDVDDMAAEQDAGVDMSNADMSMADMMMGEDMSEPERMRVMESEPNGGAMLDEVDPLNANELGVGTIGEASDTDVWFVDVQPGKFYKVNLHIPEGSELDAHLTILDAGRNDKSAGEDYVKIAIADAPEGDASMTFLTMGEGGYYMIVRDARNVGPQMASVGSDAHTYELSMDELDIQDVQGNTLSFDRTVITDALESAGDIKVYPFSANEGNELVVDMVASSDDMDGRLFIYSDTEKSWIARQDDRTIDNVNPLVDAPLFASGVMWVIVENTLPEATALEYSIAAELVVD